MSKEDTSKEEPKYFDPHMDYSKEVPVPYETVQPFESYHEYDDYYGPDQQLTDESQVVYGEPVHTKSAFLSGLLAFTLGAFGIHNFYLGYVGKGLCQCITTVISLLFVFCLGEMIIGLFFMIFPIAMGIWAFIEGVMIVCGTMRAADGCELT